jgi:hypothetical protein
MISKVDGFEVLVERDRFLTELAKEQILILKSSSDKFLFKFNSEELLN